MSGPAPIGRIEAPLVNPNEPESQVVEIMCESYSEVSRGDVVLVVETSKATFEVESEHDGYLGAIAVGVRDRVNAGELICEIFAEPPPRVASVDASATPLADAPRLTKKAAALVAELGVDVTSLPSGRFLTERDIRSAAVAREPEELDPEIAAHISDRSLVVFGAGGLGKSIIELVRADARLEAICVVDDDPTATGLVLGVPVAGTRAVLVALRAAGAGLAANAVGALGRVENRVAISNLLDQHGRTLGKAQGL